MENAKRNYVNSLLERNKNVKWNDYVERVETRKDEAKSCYADDEAIQKMNDQLFVHTMTKDACVLVEIINRVNGDKERKKLGPDDWKKIDAILGDMMLLENQIPFFVLEEIWYVQGNLTDLVDELSWLMRDIYSPPNPHDNSSIGTRPLHLLHLLGLVAFPEDNSFSQQPQAADQDLFPRLSNLLEIGVDLKKNEQARGLKVSFSDGVMTMNPQKIKGDTEKNFGNLIAFEQGYRRQGAAFSASSYVVLMNSLFQTPADVAAALSTDDRGILIRDKDAGMNVDVAVLFKRLRRGVGDFKVNQGCNARVILDWIRKSEKASSTIFKVPPHIRDLKPNAYEPTIISFGPYHHGNERLKAMQRQKWHYLEDLLKRFPNKNWKGCLGAVTEIEGEARRYYQEPLNLGDDQDFLEVMTLDGCFQIEFMTRISEKRSNIDWSIVNAVQRDIMVLENQVPFIVLRKISEYLDCRRGISLLRINFLEFLKDIYSPNPVLAASVSANSPRVQSQNPEPTASNSEDPLHLVDWLLREMFHPPDPAEDSQSTQLSQNPQSVNQNSMNHPNPESAASVSANSPRAFAQDSQSTQLPQNPQSVNQNSINHPNPESAASVPENCPRGLPQDSSDGKSNSRVCYIPGLAQLKGKGVKIVKGEKRGLKVSFDNGKMSINPHKINRNTEVYLQNLIAFEQGYLPAGKDASSYVVLMHYLVGTPEDVAVLSSRKTGILDNNLTPEEVVHLFKNLCRGISVFWGDKMYEGISRYANSKPREWMRVLRKVHLKNPWKWFAVLAAISLLLIAIGQLTLAFLTYLRK